MSSELSTAKAEVLESSKADAINDRSLFLLFIFFILLAKPRVVGLLIMVVVNRYFSRKLEDSYKRVVLKIYIHQNQ